MGGNMQEAQSVCVFFSPALVDKVNTEGISGQLHQAVHGHVNEAAPRRVACSQREAVIHQTACVPATQSRR